MKKTTQSKLDRLASHLATTRGREITEVVNFLSVSKKEAEKIGVNIHWTTLQTYEEYLRKKVLSSINPPIDFADLFKKAEAVVGEKEIVKIKIMYGDGTTKFFVPQAEETPAPQPAPQGTTPQWIDSGRWQGLFDYSGKKVYIRRGKFSGCEITNKESVLEHFRRWDLAYGWTEHQLRADVFTKFFNDDTPKDLKTLMTFNKVCKEKRG